jgi:membrane protein DedA with SNARE-associated domain
MSLFDLFNLTKDLIANLGYFGIFLGVFLEGVFPPIPSEIIMGFSGFLISEGRFGWLGVIICAVLGNFLSVSLIWLVGKKYGEKILLKWGKYIGISQKDFELAKKVFHKYGYWAVFGCQMLPLVRTLIAYPAGILGTRYTKFMLANTFGATIWFIFLTYLGFTFGKNWQQIEGLIKPLERGILVVLAFLLAFWVFKKLKKIKFRKTLAQK